MVYNIALIGAGQLGSRHLQGLKKINLPVNIEVVDPNEESLLIAKERYKEIGDNENIKNIKFINSIENLNENIDLCIIATNSNVRAFATYQIIQKKKVKAIIFEKVLFQKIADYELIKSLLRKNNIKAWINCPRRLFPDYAEIKKHISKNEKLTFLLTGGNWGLGSNGIHFIDFLAYLNDNYDFKLSTSHLDKVVHDSKRMGFVEFTGTLQGEQSNGSEIIINARNGSTAPHIITIMGEKSIFIIDETNGDFKMSLLENNWKWENKKLKVFFQSDLTGDVTQEILLKGNCGLTSFDDSAKMHISYISSLLEFYNNSLKISTDTCPLT